MLNEHFLKALFSHANWHPWTCPSDSVAFEIHHHKATLSLFPLWKVYIPEIGLDQFLMPPSDHDLSETA